MSVCTTCWQTHTYPGGGSEGRGRSVVRRTRNGEWETGVAKVGGGTGDEAKPARIMENRGRNGGRITVERGRGEGIEDGEWAAEDRKLRTGNRGLNRGRGQGMGS